MRAIKYVGSKSRIAKQIVPILQKLIDDNQITTYYEPFVGGANVIDKISCSNRYGFDINPYLIALFQNGELVRNLSDEISAEEYCCVRLAYQNQTKDYPAWYIGAIGFLASYNGKFFGGRAGTVHTKIGTVRNYYEEAKRNFLTQLPLLQNVMFGVSDYRAVEFQPNSLIYCDIPYYGTTGYQEAFDYTAFWDWAEKMSKNNIVIVSEQTAPDGWKSIWSKPVKRTLDNNSRSIATENLYQFIKN